MYVYTYLYAQLQCACDVTHGELSPAQAVLYTSYFSCMMMAKGVLNDLQYYIGILLS